MLLMVAVISAALRTLTTLRHALASVTRDAEVRETGRIARHTLAQELRTGLSGIDWVAGTGDSVVVRAFRGTAVRCADASPPSWAVRYAGLRRPDPAKDSVLVLANDGVWRVAGLVRARARRGVCGQGAGEVWELNPAVPGAVVGRVFERGSYHVAAGAFRYRPGRGGRQPLTAQVLRTGAGAASGVSGRGTGVDLWLAFGRVEAAITIDSVRIWPRETWP